MNQRLLFVFVLGAILALSICMPVFADQAAPKASGGCGSSCGAPATAQPAQPDLQLTQAQKTKLAEIDKNFESKSDSLRKSYTQKRDILVKLIDNPKASDAEISKKMHELMSIQADIQLAGILADRARDRIYTAEQKAILAKGSDGACGCGSGSGTATPAANKSAPAGGCGSSCGGG